MEMKPMVASEPQKIYPKLSRWNFNCWPGFQHCLTQKQLLCFWWGQLGVVRVCEASRVILWAEEQKLGLGLKSTGLGAVYTRRIITFARKFACKPFDIACNLCEHSH